MRYAIIATISKKNQEGGKHFSLEKGGTFITGQETDESIGIDAYEYHESMKNFSDIDMIGRVPICPICKEDVFHVDGKRAKYFSHYPNPESECAYRVKYVSETSADEVRYAVKSLPFLINFERIFLDYLSESASGQIKTKNQKQIDVLSATMKVDWLNNRTIRSAFNFESPEEMYNVFSTIAPFLIKLTHKLKGLDPSYVLNNEQRTNAIFIWRCLHLPRESSNLKFLMKLTIKFLKNYDVILNDEDDKFNEEIIFWSFGLLSLIPWKITTKIK